jgi:crotonobetainyl-CoA:carnitine CoA-transferase CaiB-like acyl-CoA transferase
MGEYTPGVVPRFSRTAGSLSDAPALGEDTTTVLSELGYDEATIDRLIDEGTVR